MTSGTNKRRAERAGNAVAAYSNTTAADETAHWVQDLVCDLGHLCDSEGLDFQQIVVTAVGWWHAERFDPDGLHPGPYVTLSIDGKEVMS